MEDDVRDLLTVLQRYREDLGELEFNRCVSIINANLEVKREDRRAAVTMALDASKSLIALGFAFFVALGGFTITLQSNFGSSWAVWLVGASAVVTLSSIVCGLWAIGRAYGRGQRPADSNGPSWSTRPLRKPLAAQSFLGLFALVVFAGAVVLWGGNKKASDLSKSQQDNSVLRSSSDVAKEESRICDKIADTNAKLSDSMVFITENLAAFKSPQKIEGEVTALNGAEATLDTEEWKRVQLALLERGFDTGAVDGKPGSLTRKAILAFQRAMVHPASGYLTDSEKKDLIGE